MQRYMIVLAAMAGLTAGCGGTSVAPTGGLTDSTTLALSVRLDSQSAGRTTVRLDVGTGNVIMEARIVVRDASGTVVARAATEGPATSGHVTLVLEASTNTVSGNRMEVHVVFSDARGATHTIDRTTTTF